MIKASALHIPFVWDRPLGKLLEQGADALKQLQHPGIPRYIDRFWEAQPGYKLTHGSEINEEILAYEGVCWDGPEISNNVVPFRSDKQKPGICSVSFRYVQLMWVALHTVVGFNRAPTDCLGITK